MNRWQTPLDTTPHPPVRRMLRWWACALLVLAALRLDATELGAVDDLPEDQPTIALEPLATALAGSDHLRIQQAIDRLGQRGGGVVRLGAGRYRLAATLHLRCDVHLIGVGEATVLQCVDRSTTDDAAAISATDILRASVRDLRLVGQSSGTASGIRLLRCDEVVLRRCVITGFARHGVHLSRSQRVSLERCVVADNQGNGIALDQGTVWSTIEGCSSQRNRGHGLALVHGVERALVSDTRLLDNRGHGIAIGERCCNNLFTANHCESNGGHAVVFQPAREEAGSHRNAFERNILLGADHPTGTTGPAPVVLVGEHRSLVFSNNTVGTRAASGVVAAFTIRIDSPPPVILGSTLYGTATSVEITAVPPVW
jgi:hypothetical protein